MTTASPTSNEHIAALRPKLVAFARLQLRENAAAEDAVQDTLVTALEKQSTFEGRSAFETWVFGILKNKILERLRQQVRYISWQHGTEQDDETLENLFKENGRWHAAARPLPWGEPDQLLENQAFWQVLDVCLVALPEHTARVFTMRELMGLSTQEICKEVGLTETNCWVILHRARLRLRTCIEKGWLSAV
ncbi:MAG: sigma-70 family RNA polymerase sigma factor [Halomonas sp.]|nr:sigma-70 family RNA polymerase sigma factor [Halomonas sp.]TVP52999.1 MAG: sigma-70 family RNA polymerase sigma factor [Halomonas sp.]